jgi:uncharacterized protein (DUF488 family)
MTPDGRRRSPWLAPHEEVPKVSSPVSKVNLQKDTIPGARSHVKIFTIGFTKSSAKNFFDRIKRSGAKRLVDVRLSNVSQLAGFAKRDDLRYFAREICHIDYVHDPQLAPSQELFDAYRKKGLPWPAYEKQFLQLMRRRRIENMDRSVLDGACLLCSEDKPHHCHRRLVAEYLRDKWPSVDIVHL